MVARRFPVAEVERMVRENVIQDAASIAAWHAGRTYFFRKALTSTARATCSAMQW